MPDFDIRVPHIARIYDYWLWRPESIHDIHSAPTAMWGGVARKAP